MHLIIQGIEVENCDLRAIAKLSAADQIERITGQAFRLNNVQQQDGVAEYCAQVDLDYAFITHHRALSDFKLIAMDMDSTLLAIESIDEIADMLNVKPEVSAITLKTMRGEISFEESITQRTALLAGLHADVLQQVYDERVKLNPGAENLIAKARRTSIKTMVVSGGFSFFTDRIRAKLNLDYAFANTLEIQDNRLTGKVLGSILGRAAKAERIRNVCSELGIQSDQVIAIGDGANDLDMMAIAGASIAYHAKPVVQEQATYAINHVGLDGVLSLFN